MKTRDALGNRMKAYESAATSRFLPLLPVIARLDGKNFSRFTKGLNQPYDKRLILLFQDVTAWLVGETNATIGYTQSDEITLTFYSADPKSQIFFDGKQLKMTSVLASMASVRFNAFLSDYIPEKKGVPAYFDCRVWQVPTLEEAANAVLWRELDATKNSIQSAAHYYYSHKELMNRHTGEMQEMLFQKGINWNNYPTFFKRGTFFQRKKSLRRFTTKELERLPQKHEARTNPKLEVERTDVKQIEMPPFSKVTNRVDVLFDGAYPEEVKNED